MNHLAKIVAVAFVLAIAVLAVASWDVSRGRVPVTASAMIEDLLNTPDDRRCDRDVSAVLARHLPPGMARADALAVLERAVVVPPRPWFWTPRSGDSISETDGEIRFVRVMRFTSFGNQLVSGAVTIEAGRVRSVAARMTCPFN